ncbi:MAG: DUF1704 domain-containing protein [Candidatus Saccharibacteria bacterium]|nr:DUF1704 domain-containing protein [Candidatus Saccharibacteria bacterium]
MKEARRSQNSSVDIDPEAFRGKYQELVERSPKVIESLVPDQESKEAAINSLIIGSTTSFQQKYPAIAEYSGEDYTTMQDTAETLIYMAESMSEPERTVYLQAIEARKQEANLIVAMRDYKAATTDPIAREVAAQRFMEINITLYGEPVKTIYESLLGEKIANIFHKKRSQSAKIIFQELRNLLPENALDGTRVQDRFRPSTETMRWMNEVVHGLYDNMLRYVDSYVEAHKSEFQIESHDETVIKIQPTHLQDIFRNILTEEFLASSKEVEEGRQTGDIQDAQAVTDWDNTETRDVEKDMDWKVEVTEAKSINIDPDTRHIRIPQDREAMSVNEVKRLVVHEIGVHVLTRMTGGSTNLGPLTQGLAGFNDTQEGLRKAMEHALEGEYQEAGIDHYITAGLAYFDNKDFKGAYDVKWRLKLLESLKPDQAPTQVQIDKAKQWAANTTMRIYRGTDDLPLFKDLCYYNGSKEVWGYLEKICGDDLQLSLLLAGKINTSKKHQRVILESHST